MGHGEGEIIGLAIIGAYEGNKVDRGQTITIKARIDNIAMYKDVFEIYIGLQDRQGVIIKDKRKEVLIDAGDKTYFEKDFVIPGDWDRGKIYPFCLVSHRINDYQYPKS